MDLFRMFDLSAGGMGAQRTRMSVVAGNLANVDTTRTPEGGVYRRRNVIFRAVPLGQTFSTMMATSLRDQSQGFLTVEVAGIHESSKPPRRVYDPRHPDADAQGYVSYPDINSIEEMVDLLSAVRSYEANLAAFNATKTLIRRLLDIGRAP